MQLPPLLLKLPAIALLGALFISDQNAATQEPPRPGGVPAGANNGDIEVMARGPIHEAFAQPGTQKPVPAPIVNQEVPPLIEEVPPEQKPEGTNVQWITGYWAWDDEASRFIWVSGFWRDIPPGRQWVPGYWARLADGYQYVAGYWGEIGQPDNQYLPEPPETIDNGPSIEAPGEDYTYVPGLWVYRETRYLWRPGYWLHCYPNYVWTPASYCWTPSGYLYNPGFWDYPLLNRGLLFAPVCFNRPLWNNVGWAWQPNYCIQPSVFFGGLFCRSNFNRYYFGDFYGAGYARRGFTPWVNNRIGGAYDANFSHYRWQNRNNPRWAQNVQDVFARRGRGELDIPGRTLAQQERQVRERGDRPGGFDRDRDRDPFRPDNPNVLAPLARLDPSVAKLERISESRLNEERRGSQELRGLGQQRANVETKLAEKGPPRKTDAPRTAKLDLPRAGIRDTKSAYPPANVLKGDGKGGAGKGFDNSKAGPAKGGDTPPRFGGLPKAPEGRPQDSRPGAIIGKQPDLNGPNNRPGEGKTPAFPAIGDRKGPDNRPGEGKLPGIADRKGPQPSVGPTGRTPPPTTGRPEIRPLPELKAPTPPSGTTKGPDRSPAPVIRNPQPQPAPAIRNPTPAPAIRNPTPAPAIRNPQPQPAPAIRNPTPAPAIRTPPPAPRPAPAIRSSPPPAPRAAPAPRSAPAPRIAPAPRAAPAPRVAPSRPSPAAKGRR